MMMYDLAKELYPICRSITGNGVRQTLRILQRECPELKIVEVPSGTPVFDWTIPKEWNISDGYIEDSHGHKIVDFHKSNLHIMGYSAPMNRYLDLDELNEIVYTQEDQPDVIPYVTSYYKERSGFCMSENQRRSLKQDRYHCVIDSELKEGSLTYGEIILEGETTQEVLLSTYICHPSLANNELSGPCVAVALVKWLKSLKQRRYTYRIVFVPETIGSIAYLSRNYKEMKQNTVAWFVLTCVGDDRDYSWVMSRYGNTLTDKLIENVFRYHYPDGKCYSFLTRGSDERQYNAPGIDLPVCDVCRTKYGMYPEYHTSADDLDLISEKGMQGAVDLMKRCIIALEYNYYYRVLCYCEPQMGKRGLYPTVSQKGNYSDYVMTMRNFIAYADGNNDLIEISNLIDAPIDDLIPMIDILIDNGLIEKNMEKNGDGCKKI